MASEYLDLMKQITRAAYPHPEADVDPMDAANLRTIADYKPDDDPATGVDVPDFFYEEEREYQEPYPNQNFD